VSTRVGRPPSREAGSRSIPTPTISPYGSCRAGSGVSSVLPSSRTAPDSSSRLPAKSGPPSSLHTTASLIRRILAHALAGGVRSRPRIDLRETREVGPLMRKARSDRPRGRRWRRAGLATHSGRVNSVPVDVIVVFSVALASALATGLGAPPFAFKRHPDRRWLGLANGLAAGFMIGASFGLLYEGGRESIVRTGVGAVGAERSSSWPPDGWSPAETTSGSARSREPTRRARCSSSA
jgi:hypothetical protein